MTSPEHPSHLTLVENEQALRQIKALKGKKAAAVLASKKPAKKQMDENQIKEVIYLAPRYDALPHLLTLSATFLLHHDYIPRHKLKWQYMELQEQTNTYGRDLKNVSLRLSSLQRDSKLNQITQTQINTLNEDIPLYRAVGKAFFYTPQNNIQGRLEKELDLYKKNEKDLLDRKEYLERRILSNSQNLKDMLA